LPSIGKPVANTAIYILDKWQHLLPLGVSGELYIGGVQVGRGYLNKPELTAEKFDHDLKDYQDYRNEYHRSYRSYRSYIYQTGDLARWLLDGNIEFLGRMDHQVKIRGFRIEPGEIESRLLNHHKVKEAVVLPREDRQGDKYLCAYIVPLVGEGEIDVPELRDYLAEKLPDYMIPSYFVQLDRVPLTPNRKIDRGALPAPGKQTGAGCMPPVNETQRELVRLWADVLGVSPGSIGIDDNFFRLGGHSLKATVLVTRIHKTFHVQMPLQEIFKAPTVRQLADYIEKTKKEDYFSLEIVEKREYYDQSSAQKRMYFLQRMDVNSTAYNISWMVPLGKDIAVNRLESALKQLIARHDSLRTSFITIDNNPVQKIHDHVPFELDYFEYHDSIKQFSRPFDLSRAPLLRSGLVKLPGGSQAWWGNMHHIISDGMSMTVLTEDFFALYRGRELAPLRLRYKDFSSWQNRLFASGGIKSQEDYWQGLYRGEIPVLDLPGDYKRPEVFTFAGNHYRFRLEPDLAAGFRELGTGYGGTLYMNILAVLNTLFYKYTGQRDIIIGSAVAGRRHEDLQHIIGMFVNMLPMRNYPGADRTYESFLKEVIAHGVEAFENQDVQFEELVGKLELERDPSRHPLFDVSLVVQNFRQVKEWYGDFAADGDYNNDVTESYRNTAVKFDITFTAREEGEDIYFDIGYYTGIFKEETVIRLVSHFKNIVKAVVNNPCIKLKDIEIISKAEKDLLLYEWNDTAAAYSADRTIHELFAEQAGKSPDSTAVIGRGQTTDEIIITYRRLNEKSDQLAAVLKEKGVTFDTTAAIMMQRSIDMIVAILGILKAGGAYLPIDPEYPEDRKQYMLKDSAAEILLTSDAINRVPTSPSFSTSTSASTYKVGPANLAYIIYTSGSTGKPKGVMVDHRNVVRLVKQANIIDFHPHQRLLMTGSIIFDVTTFEIWGPLLNGSVLYLADKDMQLDLEQLRDTVINQDISVLHLIPQLFYQVLMNFPGTFANLDYFLVGGDMVRPDPVNRLRNRYPHIKILHCYGPTENTTFSTVLPVDKDYHETIPIGKPIGNSSVYILDTRGRLQPIGAAGELCTGGDGVARGYLNRPELTAEKFCLDLYRAYKSYRTYIYKTGDLARWLSDGNIEFLGRIDRQVKIRGIRIELTEIETRLLDTRWVKEAVVIPVEEYSNLCAYVVPSISEPGSGTVAQLKDKLAAQLPAHMVPAYFVEIERMPLTASGKVDWKQLPLPENTGGNAAIAPRDDIEKRLASIWSEILSREVTAIGIDDNFFQLGGHSLKAAVLAAKLHQEFDIKVPLLEIFKAATIKQMARYIRTAKKELYISIKAVEKRQYYPVSSAQKRLYVLHHLEDSDMVYNMPGAVELEGSLDSEQLQWVVCRLIAKHETLRTSFHMVGEEVVQRINEGNYTFQITNHKLNTNFVQPFDLSRAPLLRVGLSKIEEERHILMLDLHHIISDGFSQGLFFRELMSLYNGEALPALRIQYKDYTLWQQSEEEKKRIAKYQEYWLKEFAGDIPVLSLPLDFTRPAVQGFEGKHLKRDLDKDITTRIRQMASGNDTTLFMVLLSFYTLLLCKLSGQEDIVVGTPVAGRDHADLQLITGMFVNTLALRNRPAGEKSFNDFLLEVRQQSLNAFENQEYLFEDLVEAVTVNRDTGRNPLFDVMFSLLNLDIPGIQIPGLELKPYPVEITVSKFDMVLYCTEGSDRLFLTFEYCTRLFKQETIERFAVYFKTLISAVLDNPRQKIKDIQMISPGERKQALYDFNDTRADYPADQTIHGLFAEQVARTPDHIAVSGLGKRNIQLTYDELNNQSDELAFLLKGKGIEPGAIAAVMLDRSLEMIAAVLGILKADAAYLPIDPGYPQERVDYMLSDSGSKVLLTGDDLKENLSVTSVSSVAKKTPAACNLHLQPAYIIYTSGTTGKPKGVIVEHRSVLALLTGTRSFFGFNKNDVWSLFHSYCFDFSVWEMYGSLLYGGRLVIVSKITAKDTEKFLRVLEEQKVTVLNQTPRAFYNLAEMALQQSTAKLNIRLVIFGGEALNPSKLKRWHSDFPGIRLVNMFGITETTVHCTIKELENVDLQSGTSNIGKPLPGWQVYILDKFVHPVPLGVCGELYVGGNGVARGYLNRPELTAERFCLDLYRTYQSYRTYIPGRLYKTGDLGRWLPGGNIEYLGRMDFQVKIRGFRIELGEIETQLLKKPGIKEAAVIARWNRQGDQYLCAYTVGKGGSPGELRKYLSAFIPDYMIPAYFVEMAAIPLDANGKVHRKALPDPHQHQAGTTVEPGGTLTGSSREIVIAKFWEEVLGIGSIGLDDNYFERGGNSLNIIRLNHRLKQAFEVDIPLARMFRYTTIRSQAEYIAEVKGDKVESVEVRGVPVKPFEEVAIIGMAGRFPGAGNIAEFKENLENGIESIAFFNEAELVGAGVEPALLKDPAYVKAHGFLEDNDCFDALFFGYIPAEAIVMDPQIRLFHQCCWEALENAGYDPFTYEGLIGLYAGASHSMKWEALTIASGKSRELGDFAAYQLANKDFLVTRVSYKLNLKGPSVIVQSACSTSLVAVEAACRDLQAGKCHLALAGGVGVTQFRENGYLYREGMISSSDGHCRAFDGRSEGAIPGNGAGVVVLKLSAHAEVEGDHIEAVIKGAAVNNDGFRKVGYTAPSVEGQAEVIRAAMRLAGVEADTIGYIETHGTGTSLGDPIEIEALKLAFGSGKMNNNGNKTHYCALGSVKSNMGHLDAAAGAAGLIKTVLSLKHRVLLPSLHFETPNPGIDFDNSPFYVNPGLRSWPRSSHPLRAGVSSFGIGGTNAHVVLEEAPVGQSVDDPALKGREYQLILLSAKTESALEKITENLAGYLKENPGIHLPDAAYTLHTGRRQLKHRKALVCSTIPELIDALTGAGRGNLWTGTADNDRPRVIFMFPGLGSQYVDMGRELYRNEPVFKQEMDRCFEILKPLTNYDIKEILYPELVSELTEVNRSNRSYRSYKSHQSYINRAEIAQQVVFIFEYALARLLVHWGIVPGAMIGYSFGEYTAALLSGVFTLHGALKLIAARGRLLEKLPTGAMLSIPLPENEVKTLLSGEDPDLSIAIDNGVSVVVSGAVEAVEILEKKLKEKHLLPMRLPAHRAIHSPMMKPILEEFRAEVEKIQRNKPRIPYISNVTGGWISAQEAVDPGYWVKHLEGTVRFSSGIKELLKEKGSLFLEVGPGRDLSALVGRHIEEGNSSDQHIVLNPVRHPGRKVSDLRYLLSRMGQLWIRGKSLHAPGFYQGQERRRLALPTYPFEKQRFPMEGDPFQMIARGAAAPAAADSGIYVPCWKSRLIKRNTNINIKAEPVLMFHHTRGIAPLLKKRLEETGHTVISVTPGQGFEKKGKNAYALNPGLRDDYHELLAEIRRLSSPPTLILHLWTLDSDNHGKTFPHRVTGDMELGFYSLLYLARAVGMMAFKESFRLVHITGGMQAVTGQEELAPGKAAVLGPLKVIPQEFPNIRCRSIDIVPPPPGLARQHEAVRQLLQEITGDNLETIVALRGNKRWTRHFEEADPGQLETPLKEKGIYLVTGGLGKIGLQLAHYLARDFGARLVLTGRTAFPSRQQWDSWLEEKGEQDPVSLKIKKLLEVEKQAAGLITAAVDVSDFKQVQRLLRRVEKEWGPVNGVIHAAGVVRSDAFIPVRDTLEEHCRRHFKPKIHGLMVLEKVLEGKELDFCWVMSSISAVLGGLGFAAYAAANSFMDTFVCKHNQTASTRWLSVDWDYLEAEQTWETFRKILSLEDVQQVVVSSGGKLRERINRWIKLQSPADTEEGKAGQKKQQEVAAAAWERPQLSTPYEAPRTSLQSRLTQLWQNFFKYSQIGIEDDFFELGGDSLKAITLISLIHKELNKEIPIAEFFKYATIRQQAAYLDGLVEGRRYLAVPAVEKKDYYPLSSAQKRLYVLQQMEPGSTGYNIFQAAILEGGLDREKLESVFNRLTARHEVLRTSFHMIEEEIVQRVHGTVKGGQWTVGRKTIDDFIRPFDLSKAPLLRVELTELSGQEHIIMMDIHHIISDGVSYQVFIRELMALYHGEELPKLRIQYKDYALWQQSEEERTRIAKQRGYWLKEFEGEIPVLTIPTDFARPALQSFEGKRVNTRLDASLTGRLKQMAFANDATLFMLLLSLCTLLLAKLSGQEDIVVGTPTAGREHVDLRPVFGMFVNTLALRNQPAGEKIFADFLKEVKERTLTAFANQEYLFEDLVEEVEIERDASRNPLFDVMFSLMNVDIPEIQVPGLKFKPYPHDPGISKFDMMLYCSQSRDGLLLLFEYCTRLFKHETMERFAGYFKTLVSAVLDNPRQKIKDIEIISPEEKKQLLYDFNDTRADYPKDKTIHQLFQEQAKCAPERTALIGPAQEVQSTGMNLEGTRGLDPLSRLITITYNELNERSNQLARLLQEKGIQTDTIVGIMIERSLEMITGIMGILKAGGAYLPIEPDYPQERIDYMLKDSGAKILLTGQEIANLYSPKALNNCPKGTNNNLQLKGNNLAYIIYTSGSTGEPKGVPVEHRSAVNILAALQRDYPLLESDAYLLKTSYLFDVSITELFGWFWQGGRLVVIEPGHQMDPLKILEAVKRYHITHINFVPSMFAVFLEFLEQTGSHETRNLKYIFLAGEPLPPESVRGFQRLETGIPLENLYGPTESTIYASGYSLSQWSGTGSIPIGKPLANLELFILNHYHRPQPIKVAGELCISGIGLARGYLNRPELTAEKFILPQRAQRTQSSTKKSKSFYGSYKSYKTYIPIRSYKSGDLARWLPDGNIEFLGRMDHQVKIRGYRIELGEIESCLLQHRDIREVVVIAGEEKTTPANKEGSRYICAYIVPRSATFLPDIAAIKNYLSQRLPDYMVPAFFVQMERIPLTPNGKVDRGALPEPGIKAGKDYVPPRSEIEKKLVIVWSQVLNIDQASISIDDNFFQLGGHSLKATILTTRVHKTFHVRMPLMEIFKAPTVRQLAGYIARRKQEDYFSLEAVEKREYYPLSSAQERLYVLQQMQVDGIGYNISQAAILAGQLDREKLESIFKQLIARHEALRTSFHLVEDEPVQEVHEKNYKFQITNYKPEIENKEVHHSSFITHHFVRAFDLSEAPLLRVGLLELSGQEHIIMIDIHHIISDGVSYEIFIRELMALYHGEVLPELHIQYKDYALWQQSEGERTRIAEQQEYWLKEFEGEIPVLVLPTDFTRPALQSFEGKQVNTRLDVSLTGRLKQMAFANDATLFMLLLSLCTLLLGKLSGQEDIVVGTPTAGREHADLHPVFGMFVNTLALRNRPAGEKTFTDFLREVKERTLAAFANQEYLFENLVEEVEIKRDTGRNPLFDVMFSLMNVDIPEIQVPGLKLKPYPYESGVAKFDLMLYCSESKEELFLLFEYCTLLFKPETMERFAGYFKILVSAVLDNPRQKIKDIEMISPQEREQILYDFNDTAVDYPWDKTIHGLFEEQVERTADNIAVLGNHEGHEGREGFISVTYRELNEKSNQRAGLLRQEGVEPGDIVAIIPQRSLEMMIGIFAILKAGAAYLPIDPEYPKERRDYILADSGAKILLTSDAINRVPTSKHLSFHHSTLPPFYPSSPSSLAYVIYTSGSTGTPKGVMIENRSVVNFIKGITDIIPFTIDDSILSLTTITFDIFGLETLLSLTRGSKVVIGSKEEQTDAEAAASALKKQGITIFQATPSRLLLLIEHPEAARSLRDLKFLLVGGEAFPFPLLERTRRLTNARIFNMYGPTETTIWSTVKEVTGSNALNIGKPIANTRIYIVGKYCHLQPAGVSGELLIGGDGLSCGYLNNPGLTAERFLLDFYRTYKSYRTYIYKTGDLARWLPDGNIEYLGRMDFQVKIRGFRIELGEIENQLLKKPGIKEAVVIARPDRHGDQYLCAYITGTDTTADVEELRQYLAAFMPDYMIPSYFVEIEAIPLTPNGKVDRKSLPEPQVSKGENYTAPRTRTENKLAEIWAETLDIAPQDIGIDNGFFQLGGHSLKATVMINKIHREFQVKLTLAQVFRGASIRQLARLIGEREQEIYLSIEPAPGKPYYALSAAQKRLYITQQLDPEALIYNMPRPLLLAGEVQVEKLKQALREMILRHEILRTSFRMVEGEPVQFIVPGCSPHFEYLEMNPPVTFNSEKAGEFEHLYREFVRPFDLSKAPLLRVRLVRFREREYLLVMDMHHIISDGVSGGIFSHELMALYAGQELPPLTLQYKDYSHWQNNLFAGSQIKRQEEYWLKRFEGDIPRLNLPLDYPEPSICDTRCDLYPFHIPAALTAKAGEFIKKTGSTPYILLLAVYTILLSRYCGQEDIIVGSAIAGRRHPDLEKIMGVFINMLAMRNYPRENLSFMEFLEQVKTNALDAYENQDFQFDELVNKLGIKSPPGLTPLIDTQFTFQDAAELLERRQTVEVPGLRMKPFPLRSGRMNIQLGLHAWPELDKYKMLWVYLTALFKPSTIENMAKRFVEILEQCMENNEIKLKEIGISHALVEGTTGLTDKDVMNFEF